MIELIKQNLSFTLPQVVNSFGGADRFINQLVEQATNNYEVDQYLHHLLSAPEVVILNPASPSFLLYENDLSSSDLTLPHSIVFQEPYSVYTVEGELLYRVSNHQGVFGQSILDKTLLLQSKSTDLYYLHYKSYQGEKAVLLVINLFATSTKKINPGIQSSDQVLTPLLNQTNHSLSVTLTDGYRDLTKLGLPLYPIDLYFLNNSAIVPSKTSVVSASSSYRESYYTDLSSSFTYQPSTSGWLVLTQKTTLGDQFLKLSSITGTGTNQLIEVSDRLYFLALDNDPITKMVSQTLGVTLPFLSSSTTQSVQIRANLGRS